MMSRPHSPFKRSSRPPSRSSPGRSPSKNSHNRHSEDMSSPKAYFAGPTMANGSHGAGPSRNGDTSPGTSYGSSLSRAEHYDVVLEGEAAAAVLPHLGAIVLDQLGSLDDSEVQLDGDFDHLPRSGSGTSIHAIKLAERSASRNGGSVASADRHEAMLQELLHTERSYVKRIETLYKRYAVPLRQLARDRDTAIIPLYEAQRLFGNIGELVGANSAFLKDLESLFESRDKGRTFTSLGEVVYRNVACFSCYNEYFNNFEKAKHIEQTMTKTNRAYREFVDRTKANTSGLGNVGLRELIMEPVQRIPRYTMLLDGLVKNLPTSDPNRGRLEEAIVLASRIASCEVDDKTKRAAVLWSFARSVDGFPAGLISVHRQFIDCIDVDDFPIDVLGPAAMNTLLSPASNATMSPNYRTLHCTLFLFDDVIAITKRASASSCGRILVGLDDLNRLADQMKTFTERSSSNKASQKVELGFRGLIELADVQAVDIGGPDFQIAMAKGPSHISGEKWSSRLVRQFATIDATSLSGPDPSIARNEKYRFLENLWRAQALLKAREFRSHVRSSVVPSSCNEERIRRVIYWNVYSRRPYLVESRKSLAILHVDPEGEADQLPFGYDSMPPGAIVRIHEIKEGGAECTFSITLKDGSKEEGGDDGLEGQSGKTLAISDLANQLYKAAKSAAFSTNLDFEPPRGGSPSTPSSSHRGRSLATGLEQFGRNLFGTPNSIRSTGTGGTDLFGNKRSRSKGSSNFSRNPSTSTRLTQSTAGTSSIGSRGMLGASHQQQQQQQQRQLDVPCNGGVMSSIEKYRRMGGEEMQGDPKTDSESVSPPNNNSNQSTPSPIKRKPVPSSISIASPQRIPSASKRGASTDATPTDKPCKRVASGRRSAAVEKEEEEGEDQFNFRSVSPSPTRRPGGPRAVSVATPVSRNGSVAPLRVRKDTGQPRQEQSRQEKVHSTWKDLEALREAMVDRRDLLQSLQLQGVLTAQEAQNCTQEQESTAEILLRLRENLMILLSESSTTTTKSAPTLVKPVSANASASEVKKLQAQVSSLTRKCELLSALENDGRLENTELHKAFNEELDRMYEDAGLGEVEQIAKLRMEVKRAKSQRNEANIENKSLQRELALEKAQGEVWKALLESNGLI